MLIATTTNPSQGADHGNKTNTRRRKPSWIIKPATGEKLGDSNESGAAATNRTGADGTAVCARQIEIGVL